MTVLTVCLRIKQAFSSPYHIQTNGLTERLNRTIKQVIVAYVDPLHQTWDQVLPYAIHAYNTIVQFSTKFSPFRTLYGRDLHLPPDKMQPNGYITYKQSNLFSLQHNLQQAQQR